MRELTKEEKTEMKIIQARKELEPLTNEAIILRSLASLVSHNLPSEVYYQIMASVLREKSERTQVNAIYKLLSQLSNKKRMVLIQLLIAVLATYRLSRLLPKDDGPLFIFTRIRLYIGTKMLSENDTLGFWASIDKWANCPYCQGLYVAVLVAVLSKKKWKFGDWFLLVFAIAGGQSLLQEWSEK